MIAEPKCARKRSISRYKLEIDYETARHSWFLHKGQAYCVEHAPSIVIRLAIFAVDGWRFGMDTDNILSQEVLDMAERWFLLCAMIERGTPLTLYGSREAAEKAS